MLVDDGAVSNYTIVDYESMSKSELQELLTVKGIPFTNKETKVQLISKLINI